LNCASGDGSAMYCIAESADMRTKNEVVVFTLFAKNSQLLIFIIELQYNKTGKLATAEPTILLKAPLLLRKEAETHSPRV
jgi:hypothetical protein